MRRAPRSSAACRSAPAARGCCAATIRSTRRWKRRPRPSSAPRRALFFGGGFVANSALFSTLPQRGDLIVHDELIHASVARRHARWARPRSSRRAHNDAARLRGRDRAPGAAAGGTGRVWIAVESLYSMDGDRAPARRSRRASPTATTRCSSSTRPTPPASSARTGAGSAHGSRAATNVITLHTCGKALGVAGALVAGAGDCCATSSSTAPAVHLFDRAVAARSRPRCARRCASARASRSGASGCSALIAVAGRRARAPLRRRAVAARRSMPVIVGADDARRWRSPRAMQAHGFDVRAHPPADRAGGHRAAAHVADAATSTRRDVERDDRGARPASSRVAAHERRPSSSPAPTPTSARPCSPPALDAALDGQLLEAGAGRASTGETDSETVAA